jgi:hypothetical protein
VNLKDFHVVKCDKLSAIEKDEAETKHNNKNGNDENCSNSCKSPITKHTIFVWLLGIVIAIAAMFIKPLVGICLDSNYDFMQFLVDETWQITGILVFIGSTMSWNKKYKVQKGITCLGIIVGVIALIIYVIVLCREDVNVKLIQSLNVIDFLILVILSVAEAIVYCIGTMYVKKGVRA